MTVREAGAAEAEALAAFLNEQSKAVFGTSDLSPEAVAGWFLIPDLDVLVVEVEGRLVAYADMQNHGDEETVWVDPRALPSHPRAVESLFAELETRAAGRGRRVVRAVVADTEDATREILERRGYRPIRHSYRMLIELQGENPPPAWPAGIAVRTAEPGEEEAVYAAYVDAFADHWGFVAEPFEHWRSHQAESPLSRKDLWFLALDGDDIAGVCLCATHESGERDHGWVNILGVRPPWRRRGLGEALLRQAFHAFAAEGATKVALGVDGENTTGAVRLYERAGMRVVRRYDTYERRLDG